MFPSTVVFELSDIVADHDNPALDPLELPVAPAVASNIMITHSSPQRPQKQQKQVASQGFGNFVDRFAVVSAASAAASSEQFPEHQSHISIGIAPAPDVADTQEDSQQCRSLPDTPPAPPPRIAAVPPPPFSPPLDATLNESTVITVRRLRGFATLRQLTAHVQVNSPPPRPPPPPASAGRGVRMARGGPGAIVLRNGRRVPGAL